MGTNILPTASDGTVIPASNHNNLVTALTEHFVPRNTTTKTPGDLEGNLGSSTYRWNTGYIKEMVLGAIASGLSVEESAGDLVIKVGGATVSTFEASSGLIGTGIKDASIPKNKMVSLGQQTSSGSGSFSTNSTAFVDVTGLSLTITTEGRPVFVCLIPDGSISYAGVTVLNSSGVDETNAKFLLNRNAASIGSYEVMLRADPTTATSSLGTTVFPSIFSLDTPSAGTHTYNVKVLANSSDDYISVKYVKLMAFEL